MSVRYLVGDTRDRTAEIPSGSVSLVACSPPFIALRSYLPAGHPDKDKEIGSEPDPATFVQTLLELSAEWGRVLAPWGSIAIELGDTYSGSGGAGGDYNKGGMRDGQNAFVGSSSFERRTDTKDTKVSNGIGSAIRDLHGKVQGGGDGWPRAKCLALVPQAYALSLAYGRNVLTGEPSPAGQWLVRNVIVWQRPNPAVGALGDKFRPSTSYITVATRSAKRWFDLTAVRGAHKSDPTKYSSTENTNRAAAAGRGEDRFGDDTVTRTMAGNAAGAPPLDAWFDEHDEPGNDSHDTWVQTTQPSKLAHYAMWPAKLAERLILSMCPAEVCAVCDEPRRRVEGVLTLDSYRGSDRPQTRRAVALADAAGLSDAHIAAVRAFGTSDAGKALALNNGNGKNTEAVKVLAAEAKGVLGGYFREFVMSTNAAPTSTWTDCGHGKFIPGTVLDPFAGTFTTGLVAEFHCRDAIGIDLDGRNELLVPARREEVRRTLNPTHVTPMAGQADLFGDAS